MENSKVHLLSITSFLLLCLVLGDPLSSYESKRNVPSISSIEQPFPTNFVKHSSDFHFHDHRQGIKLEVPSGPNPLHNKNPPTSKPPPSTNSVKNSYVFVPESHESLLEGIKRKVPQGPNPRHNKNPPTPKPPRTADSVKESFILIGFKE
ncbi:hypothetical protein VNO77_27326 [Canavalia gladiata]|uniref:Uncharacterized protein n=1 Tax=Canavalia gladiata TaxID=3824 RepID=A0AAN9KTY1_CANGL